MLDVGSWREGGGRNLNTAPSPPEMDNRAPEEGSTGLGTSTPPGEADEPGRNVTTDCQREKRDGRERLPPSGPPQPKLNGGQQPPAGVPTHFDPAFRSMMPPYVSQSLTFWTDHMSISNLLYLILVFISSWPCVMITGCVLDVPRLSSNGFWPRARKLQIPCTTRWSKVSSHLNG